MSLPSSLQLGEIRVLEAISAGAPLPVLLDLMARSIEAIIPEAMASILLLDADGVHLRHGAGPRLPPAYMLAIDGGEIGPLAGSCGTATYLRQLVIAADIEHDPRWAAYKELALGFGLRACWSMPVLTVDGAVLATYAVYYTQPRSPEPAELRVLERMASLVRIGIGRDRKDELLRESEERFRLLSWATNDAIWDWDLVSDVVWWSEGFEAMFGHDRREIEPTIVSWESRIHPDDQERVIAGIRAAIQGGQERWSDEYRFLRKDGTYAQVTDRGQVIREPDGRPIRMVGGITDISRRLALEEQLRRTQQLEALGQLTGGVAHDFNNLLTVIIGNADLLLEELPADATSYPLAEMIAGAAQRGAELTSRLLAFARRQPLDPRAVQVNDLVRGMDGLLRRTLGAHIEIHLALADGLWPALVDPVQLDSALLNLCLNARDAMPGGGQLTIETSNTELDEGYAAQYHDVEAGEYVLLAVSDTGVGIPEEHLGRVFEPFFTTKEIGKGTGMGLAMVFGFMKQTGGHTNVYSERHLGTTVRLYLPRVRNGSELASAPAVTPTAALAGGSETILLVEDEELVRRYAHDQLLALGYTVVAAANGPEALEILQNRPDIELLFTDVVMPGGMNGRDLADAARALHPGLRVLFASGYTQSAIMHNGRLNPGVHFLSKPYRRPDLARKIREALA